MNQRGLEASGAGFACEGCGISVFGDPWISGGRCTACRGPGAAPRPRDTAGDTSPPVPDAWADAWARDLALALRGLAGLLDHAGPRYARTAKAARAAVAQAERDGLLPPDPSH